MKTKLQHYRFQVVFTLFCLVFLGCESKYSEPPVEGVKKSDNNLQKAADSRRADDQQFSQLKKRLAASGRIINAISNYQKADYESAVERTKAVFELLKTTGTRFESIVPVEENGVASREINIKVPKALEKDFPCESIGIEMKSKQVSNEKRAFEYITNGCNETDEKLVLLKGEISNSNQTIQLPLLSSITHENGATCSGGISQTSGKNDQFSCDKLALPFGIEGQKYTLNSFSIKNSAGGNDSTTLLKVTNENLDEYTYELNKNEILNVPLLKRTNSAITDSTATQKVEAL